jgi:hypothetical protein
MRWRRKARRKASGVRGIAHCCLEFWAPNVFGIATIPDSERQVAFPAINSDVRSKLIGDRGSGICSCKSKSCNSFFSRSGDRAHDQSAGLITPGLPIRASILQPHRRDAASIEPCWRCANDVLATEALGIVKPVTV